MRKLLIPLLMIFSFNLHALLEVCLDGTKPYTEIQTAITEAVAGDTILVHPGTYYENLVMDNTINLSLISLEATTNDTTYISRTIINGSQNQGAVILLHENVTNLIVQGLTITEGSGYPEGYQTHGGGVFILQGKLSLINSIVEYNSADQGGGVYLCPNGDLTLSGTTIRYNISYTGGGGLLLSSSYYEQHPVLIFDQVNRSSIYGNYAQQGADIHWFFHWAGSCEIYLDKFTVANPERYYIDYWDLSNSFFEDINFTPFPVIDIQQGVYQLIDADLYVANEGDDRNSGLTPEEPFKTVHKAFKLIKSNPENPRTIYMAPGIYNNTVLNRSDVPIALKSFVTLEGVSPEETKIIIDKSLAHWPVGVVNCVSLKFEDITVKNLSLTNLSDAAISGSATKNFRVENVIVENCNSGCVSAVFITSQLNYATVYFKDVIVRNNISETSISAAGNIYAKEVVFDNVTVENNINMGSVQNGIIGTFEIFISENLVIKNSKFINNESAVECFGGANFRFCHFPGHVDSAKIYVDNCLFANNTNGQISRNWMFIGKEVVINNSTFANNSGGTPYVIAVATPDGTLEIHNTIIANNAQPNAIQYGSSLIMDNCLFSNVDNITNSTMSMEPTLGENNIYGADPLFAGTDPSNPTYYMLAGDDLNGYSPAIDAGSRDFSFMPDWYEEPQFDLYGNPRIFGERIDIGCYEYQGYTVDNDIETVTDKFTATNYPNPFNPETTIEFNNPVQGEVKINIYNLKGQLVKSLLQDNLTQGVHKVVWQGTDSNNRQVASGVYFYRITSSNRGSITKKIILMK
ncbi:MAG: T9SS type A sorting domain-containing protein [Candidatus Cloacimonadales bacterium]